MSAALLKPGIVLAALEACCLYVLLDLLQAALGKILPPGLGLAIFFALPLAWHLWVPRTWRRRLIWEALGVLLFVGVLKFWTVLFPVPAGIRAGGMLLAVLGGVLWGLGSRAGRLRPDFGLFLGEFQFGLAILLVLYGLEARGGIEAGPLVPLTVLFFLLGLIGLFRCRDAAGMQPSPGEGRRGRWGLLAGSLLLVLSVALWILAVIRPGLLAWALASAEQIGHFLVSVGARILNFLVWLFPPAGTGPVGIAPQHLPVRGGSTEIALLFQLSEQTRRIGGGIVAAGWVALVVVALWRVSMDILRWFRRRLGFSDGAQRASLEGAFREDLWRILGALMARLRALMRRLLRHRRGRTLAAGAAGVRQAYRRLLEMAAEGGYPRGRARTPDEHLEVLLRWLPEARDDMAFITGQYVLARYGPGPVGEGIPKELVLRLRTVRGLLRKRGNGGLFRRRRACKVARSPVETCRVRKET